MTLCLLAGQQFCGVVGLLAFRLMTIGKSTRKTSLASKSAEIYAIQFRGMAGLEKEVRKIRDDSLAENHPLYTESQDQHMRGGLR